MQASKIDEINAKTQGQIMIDNNKANNDMHLNNLQNMHEINTMQPPVE